MPAGEGANDFATAVELSAHSDDELAVDIEALALSNQMMRRYFADREENRDPRASDIRGESRLDNQGMIREPADLAEDHVSFSWCAEA